MFDSVRGIYCAIRRPNLEDLDTITRWLDDPYLNSTVFDSSTFVNGAQEQAMTWLEQNATVYGADNLLGLVCSVKSGKPIGMVWFNNIDWKSRTADLRYLVGEAEYRTSVFGPEIALLSLQMAFNVMNLHKIFGYVLSGNENSMSLAEFGGIKEGVLKNYVRVGDGWNDYHLYAMFSDDFRAFLQKHKDGVLRRHFKKGLF
ncbi:GNAT family N-acetyltransferase [Enterovibrio norvegicus]|uniref:GNAT family N-acetyltransferase n=1 Tax=Enterovibrio norvegicus TaxID=188144 RepID=A0A2N7L426_9GAMM|nr:GNAT family protein [Enterovibrio norvegicus]PML77137.1 GNAT family N-acetyltransferase [Enterovibrio norvegicus]PMN65709.1 GNAT family N-acetyltransferase [Enterovibrio norvegicus]PMN88130.1 GNAT family N-acetyltransferase [Enterovibrio norvegicus]